MALAGTASGSPVEVPGMLKAIQWRTSPIFLSMATSGSWAIKTKLTVLGGTLLHASLGETKSVTDWVNFAGITAPSSNAGEVSVRPGTAGAAAGGACAPAGNELVMEIGRIAHVVSICVNLILLFSPFKFAGNLISFTGYPV